MSAELVAELRAQARRTLGSQVVLLLLSAADALEAAEAALKFKQGLIEDISRDCERAEAELTRRDTQITALRERQTELVRLVAAATPVPIHPSLAAAPVSLEAVKAVEPSESWRDADWGGR